MDAYPWIVVAHVVFVIVAFGAHGYSAIAMLGVKRESERARLSALLGLSSTALVVAGITLLVAVILGIVAAAMGGHFGRLWPWVSIVVVVAVWVAMTPLAAGPMSGVRAVLGLPIRGKIIGPPGTDAELAAAQARIHPEGVAVVGLGAIAVLVWLMELKPF
jgi:hypothetical protein